MELHTSVTSQEPRHAARALRKFLTKTRKHVDRSVLGSVLREILGDHSPELKAQLEAFVAQVRVVLCLSLLCVHVSNAGFPWNV